MTGQGPKPPAGSNAPAWGSDVIAAALREQDIPYVCINPGSSYRGLHDSIVNYLGDRQPKMLVCLHEEHAVAIAQGYAQVTDQPLAVIVHSNVGLMHATMAIFNAWCGRHPVLILGATGPVDAQRRRPWIDWIHTAADQGALVRGYTKWDDQPASPGAAVESIRRAAMIARTAPRGPVYVNLDAGLQEMELDAWPETYDVSRFRPPQPAAPPAEDLERIDALLAQARKPVLLCGRLSRSEAAWRDRVRLAEAIGAGAWSSAICAAGFPTGHRLFRGALGFTVAEAERAALRESDLVIDLDWPDLGGTLKQVWAPAEALPPVVTCSVDYQLHNGWSMDYQALAPADVRVAAVPESLVSALLARLGGAGPAEDAPARTAGEEADAPASGTFGGSGPIGVAALAEALNAATRGTKVCLIAKTLGWPATAIGADHPLDYVGQLSGAGIGAGPGLAVGAALALRDMGSDRLPVAVLGDGDYLMGVNALWTAAANRLPLLIVTGNNRSFFNDELHQERVALQRGRPVENRWIGQRIDDPAPDLAALARAQGLEGDGPVDDLADLPAALERAVERVQDGAAYVLDVVVEREYLSDPADKRND